MHLSALHLELISVYGVSLEVTYIKQKYRYTIDQYTKNKHQKPLIPTALSYYLSHKSNDCILWVCFWIISSIPFGRLSTYALISYCLEAHNFVKASISGSVSSFLEGRFGYSSAFAFSYTF